jgi:hypothetical protein
MVESFGRKVDSPQYSRDKVRKQRSRKILIRRKQFPEGIAARLMEIARETGPIMNDSRTSKELMDEVYDDETGFPK